MSDDILEDVLVSAEARATAALRTIRRRLFGDEGYEAALKEELALDQAARKGPPPPPGIRRRLIPNWGWRKHYGR